MLGTQPFGLDDGFGVGTAPCDRRRRLAVLCFAKGRVLLGLIGLFVPVVAVVGAVRLAHPTSPWARWRYDDARRRRATARFAADRPLERAGRRIADIVAGAPSTDSRNREETAGPPD